MIVTSSFSIGLVWFLQYWNLFRSSLRMTTCRSMQLVGAVYLLLGVIGIVEHARSTAALYFFLHLLIGIWAICASEYRITAVRFARKAAVLFSILALIERQLPSSIQSNTWPAVPNDILVIHIATALATAYYGYYWTDAAVEAHHRIGDDRPGQLKSNPKRGHKSDWRILTPLWRAGISEATALSQDRYLKDLMAIKRLVGTLGPFRPSRHAGHNHSRRP